MALAWRAMREFDEERRVGEGEIVSIRLSAEGRECAALCGGDAELEALGEVVHGNPAREEHVRGG